MRSSGPRRLKARLEPHVAGEFDPTRYRWWPRDVTRPDRVPARALRQRRQLEAELPALVEQLAELVAGGCDLTAATARVAWRGRGHVSDDLAEIAQQLRGGRSPADVWRRWATSTGSDAVGAVAGMLAIEEPATDLARQLRRQAQSLRQRAHGERVAALSRRVRCLWLAAVTQLAAIALVLLA
jgi:hypothetical protein